MASAVKRAISSYKTFLMSSEDGSAYSKLIDIKTFPNLGDTPELLDRTTLSEAMHTFILGLKKGGALDFTANYTLEEYKKIEALKGKTLHLGVFFGGTDGADGFAVPTGEDGKFCFDGEVQATVSGADVDNVVNMTITVAASTPIVLNEEATVAGGA